MNVETGKLIFSLKKQRHSKGVESVAVSPDNKTIVSGSKDKTIKVWDLETKKIKFTLEGHKGWVYCVAISPDGSTIVSCSRDKTIRVWDLYTGECIRILEGHTDWVYSVAISPDGKTLVSCSRDKTVKIWGLKVEKYSIYSCRVCDAFRIVVSNNNCSRVTHHLYQTT